MVRRAPHLRAPPGPAAAAACPRPERLPPSDGLLLRSDTPHDLPRHSDAASRRACRQLLSCPERRRKALYGRGRGGPRAVRVTGGHSDRQRVGVPRRAAGACRPGGARGHLASGRGRVRCQDRPTGVVQSRGKSDREIHLRGGPVPRRTPRCPQMPVRQRAGNLARRDLAAVPTWQGRDVACGADRPRGPRRSEPHRADQRHADPRTGRHSRVGGGDTAGPRPAGGDGAVAGRVPGHGEP